MLQTVIVYDFQDSGLSVWLASQMSVFSNIPPWAMIFAICLIVSFSTEVTSNTAICTIFMPILAELVSPIQTPALGYLRNISGTCMFQFEKFNIHFR